VTLKWLEGLRSVKHISGELRQVGSISNVVFDSPARASVPLLRVTRVELDTISL
jgi:hypothetical protein